MRFLKLGATALAGVFLAAGAMAPVAMAQPVAQVSKAMANAFNEANAAIAAKEGPVAFLHVNYGQRTEKRELSAFNAIADFYGVEKRLVCNLDYLKEFRISSVNDYKVGDQIDVSVFEEGDKVIVTSKSKGRGFQGVVKRYGFHGGPKTHGQKNRLRAPGSIGATTPQRVVRGKKMPGRMGNNRKTIKNLEVIQVDKENNILAVKGAVPGMRGALVEVRKIEKKK